MLPLGKTGYKEPLSAIFELPINLQLFQNKRFLKINEQLKEENSHSFKLSSRQKYRLMKIDIKSAMLNRHVKIDM